MLTNPLPLLLLLAATVAGNAVVCAADLPEFSTAATVNNMPASARFFGGVSIDGGSSYTGLVPANAPVDLDLGIEIPAMHQAQAGQIYAVVRLGEQLFQYLEATGFVTWDGQLDSLRPARTTAALADRETISLLDRLALGPAGLADSMLQVYLAYSPGMGTDELVYSASPLTFTVAAYDPAQLPYAEGQVIDTVVADNARQREIPIRVFLPATTMPAPLVLFSHGLGGNRFGADYLSVQWSRRGYVAVNLQHPGSDESILDVPAEQLLQAFNDAASLENSILRIEDVSAVLDQLEVWNSDPDSPFYLRLDLNRIGMTGHSFGARTTQSVSGENTPFIPGVSRDPRIDAAILFSPSPPSVGDPQQALAAVDIPWLLMTGTFDDSSVTNVTAADRLRVFPALPPGSKYELVLFEGYHHAFTDRELSPLQEPRNPAHHGIIEALTTAFLDAYLRDDLSARAWLDGDDARSILLPGDTWQLK